MPTNLSKQKRDALLAKISAIRAYISAAPQNQNTGSLLTCLSDLEKDVNGKKYGLIFEEHREAIDETLAANTPVLNDSFRHSKWLSFMSKRLELAKHLLSEKGIIFISIDDNEVAQLKILCDTIFGNQNFRSQIVRATGTPTGQGNATISNELDYILVYVKTETAIFNGLPFDNESAKIYNMEDEFGRYLTRPLRKTGGEDRRDDRLSMYYPITAPDGTQLYPIAPSGYESRWRCQESTYCS